MSLSRSASLGFRFSAADTNVLISNVALHSGVRLTVAPVKMRDDAVEQMCVSAPWLSSRGFSGRDAGVPHCPVSGGMRHPGQHEPRDGGGSSRGGTQRALLQRRNARMSKRKPRVPGHERLVDRNLEPTPHIGRRTSGCRTVELDTSTR